MKKKGRNVGKWKRERTEESCNTDMQAVEFDKITNVELQIWFLSS